MAQPAANWNAEATDAKGYWVTTPDLIERVDVDWDEIQPTAERTAEAARVSAVEAPEPAAHPTPSPTPRVARRVQALAATLPVAPLAEAALPADLDDNFEVPEFTLSEKAKRAEASHLEGRAKWEILDTYVPDGVEEAQTEEVARAPATNVKVFARSKAFTEAITHDMPGSTSHGVSIEGPAAEAESEPAPVSDALPAPLPSVPLPSHGAVARVQMDGAPEAPPTVPAEELSMDAKRALARAMAAKALAARTERSRNPGSLPPVEELLGAPSDVVLSARSQESWAWDEADPLAAPAPHETPTPAPRGPSLSLVRSTPSTEVYADTLATPLPTPPRPDVVVPWPLPTVRARIGQPLSAPGPQLAEIDAMDSVSLEQVGSSPQLDATPEEPGTSGASIGMWIAAALALAATMLVAGLGSLAMFCLVVLLSVFG